MCQIAPIKKGDKIMGFSKEFLWGSASAAYQVEGAYNEDGKALGIWDALSEGHVRYGENGETACDHYHRYKEDVALMKKTVGPDTEVKASGGIRDYETCMAMIEAGAERIGTSASVTIIEELKQLQNQ